MDIREIRRLNLLLLRQEIETVKEIADRVDTDANYISQLMSGKGKYYMGHAMARRLERACNKPSGWMDQPHTDPEDLEEDLNDITAMARAMNAVQRHRLRHFMRSMVQPPPPSNDPPPPKKAGSPYPSSSAS